MPITFKGLLEDVDAYEGKNGFGANVTVSQKVGKKVKRLQFRIKSREMADMLERMLGEEVTVTIELDQNNYGLRFGELLEVC